MDIKEMYVFNEAVGGGAVFSLPELTTQVMSNLVLEATYEDMIAKGWLESPAAFTAEGIKIGKRLLDYKEGKSYVKIGTLTLSLLPDGTGILLRRGPAGDDYTFERVDMAGSVESLIETYPFLRNGVEPQTGAEPKEYTYEELQESHAFNPANSIYFSSVRQGENAQPEVLNALFFTAENKLFYYNRDEGLLYRKGAAEIQAMLRDRMVL